MENHSAELDRLGDEIAELSAHLDAAAARLLELIREFDAQGGWNTGFRSCAEWLSWRTSLDLGAAREKVRVARALGSLPRLAQALAQGELSYAKVRALTRVATPETEERLLAVGRAGTAEHVERIVRGWRWMDRKAEAQDTDRQHKARAQQAQAVCGDVSAETSPAMQTPEIPTKEPSIPDSRCWSAAFAFPRKRPSASPVTPARWSCATTPRADWRRSAPARARSRPRYAGRSSTAIKAVASRAAMSGSARAITSVTGRRVAPPRCPTSRCCVAGITGRCTRRVTRLSAARTARWSSGTRMDG